MSITKPTEKKVCDFREGPDCVVWELTLRCNLRCKHCGVNAETERANQLTTDECLQICEDLKRIKTKVITLMGGEILLRKDWYQIAEKIRSLGMKITVVSNAFLITDEILDALKELDLWHIVYSLDGATAEVHDGIRGVEGSFDKVISAVERTISKGLPAGIITTVQKDNLFDLRGIRDLVLAQKGKLRWQVQVASYHGGRMSTDDRLTLEEYYFLGAFINETMRNYDFSVCPLMGAHDIGYFSENLYRVTELNKANWSGCTAGINTLGIDSQGNVKGCLSLPDSFTEGNIRQRPLSEIWNDPASFACNRSFDQRNLEGFCAACRYRLDCEAGCSDLACSQTGSPGNDPYCFYRIEQFYHHQ